MNHLQFKRNFKGAAMKTAVLAFLTFAGATPACAATYHFSYDYNGTAALWDTSFDDPLGQVIGVGDSYTLTIHAEANKAWRVLSDFRSGLDNAFLVAGNGVRYADVVAMQMLGGDVIRMEQFGGVLQAYLHTGGQQLSYSAGGVFDRFTLEYTLLEGSVSATILDRDPDFYGSFLSHPQVAYIDFPEIADVPLPASLPLLFGAFAGLVCLGRCRKPKRALRG